MPLKVSLPNGAPIFEVSETTGKVALNGVAYLYPASQGSANQYLSNNGNGTLNWVNPSASLARVTANVTNLTTTFSNLTDLSLPVISGSYFTAIYKYKCNNSVAAEGIKFDFNGGNATMTSFWAVGSQQAGGTTVAGTLVSTALNGVINWSTITGETLIEITVSGVINAGGTLIPRFAESSTSSGTATLELGSFVWGQTTPN